MIITSGVYVEKTGLSALTRWCQTRYWGRVYSVCRRTALAVTQPFRAAYRLGDHRRGILFLACRLLLLTRIAPTSTAVFLPTPGKVSAS